MRRTRKDELHERHNVCISCACASSVFFLTMLVSSLSTVESIILPDNQYKACPGTDGDSTHINGFINSFNIDSFINCTVVRGSIDITPETFEGDEYHETEPITVEQLNALSKIQVIEHYLSVSAAQDGFTSLSFLRNLHTIRGQRVQFRGISASLIVHSSSLRSLGLVNLKSILYGRVVIQRNPDLCFAESIRWERITSGHIPPLLSRNKNSLLCRCSDRCIQAEGCWGTEADQCQSCINYRHVETLECLEICDDRPMLYADSDLQLCRPCDVECLDGCTGEGPGNCS